MKFTKSHEWIEFLDETTVRIGLTPHAAKQMGDLVFVNLPEEGDEVEAGESLGDAESIKAVSDIYSPVSGVVSKVNEEVLDDPASINRDALEAWLVEVQDVTDQEEFLDEDEYQAHCEAETH